MSEEEMKVRIIELENCILDLYRLLQANEIGDGITEARFFNTEICQYIATIDQWEVIK